MDGSITPVTTEFSKLPQLEFVLQVLEQLPTLEFFQKIKKNEVVRARWYTPEN